jgi:phasin family protein
MYTGSFNSAGANPFKFFDQMKMPEFDYDAAISACCKNVEAISEAHKKALEALSAMSQMHSEFTRSTIQELGQFMKSFTSAKTLEEKVQLHNDAFKQGVEKAVTHGRSLAEKISKTHKDMTSHVTRTWNDNMKHAKDSMKTATKKS